METIEALRRYLDASPDERLGQAVYNIARSASGDWTPDASAVFNMADAAFVDAVGRMLTIDEKSVRRPLDWYCYADDGIHSASDVVAALRFDPAGIAQAHRPNAPTVKVWAWSSPAVGEQELVVHGFDGPRVRFETEFDGSMADGLIAAQRLAEGWAHRMFGSGWVNVPAEEVRAAELARLRPGGG